MKLSRDGLLQVLEGVAPLARQVSITEKPRAMKRSARRERVGPETLRLATMTRSARSASLLVGATSARRRNVHRYVFTRSFHPELNPAAKTARGRIKFNLP